MFVHNIDPVMFSLGPLSVRWYGVFYALGWLITYWFVSWVATKKKLMTNEQLQNYFIYMLVGTVAGARIGSIISDWRYYMVHPFEIFAIWQGGVAFHGGLVAALLVSYWYFKKHKIDMMKMADIIVIPVTFVLGIGRIGNFINGEFYGKITTVPWAVKFPGIDGFRHPVPLYETVQMFIMAPILYYAWKKKHPAGTVFALFLVFYGLGRLYLESLKDSTAVTHIFGFTWGQFFCIPMIIVGGYLLQEFLRKKTHEK